MTFLRQTVEHVQTEVEENEEEVEYVVERLETDDELDYAQIKVPSDELDGEVEEEDEDEEEEEDDEDDEYEEEEMGSLQMPVDDEDVKQSIKKIKIERVVSSSVRCNVICESPAGSR